jgi:hypothetical protein
LDVRSASGQFDVTGLDFELSQTRMTVIPVSIGASGTSTLAGSLRGVRLVALSDTSSTWTMFDIGSSTTLTTTGIFVSGGHWSLLPAAATEFNIAAALLPFVEVDDSNIINVANTVASAGTITLPHGPSYFDVTGTTTITNITASYEGRIVTLKFASTAQATDGGNLILAGNNTGAANRQMTLVCDGTNWREMSRSVN